jgi:uncharacterized protein YkwD
MKRTLCLAIALCAADVVSAQSFQEQVIALVNQARRDNGGLPPLKGHAQLGQVAQDHTQAMATRNFFMHCDPDNQSNPGTRISAAGYSWNTFGENIAAAQSSPSAVMASWMNSSGHRSNILNTSVQEMGVGYVVDSADTNNVRRSSLNNCSVTSSSDGPFVRYWTQVFARRSGATPVIIAGEAFSTSSCTVNVYAYALSNPQQMRFRNNAEGWSAWGPYVASSDWTLSGSSGATVSVSVQVQHASGATTTDSDSIQLGVACTGDVIMANGFES